MNTECLSRNKTPFIRVIYVNPLTCAVPPCDESMLKPYDNLFYELIQGWRRVNPYHFSSLNFKLLGNGLDGALESSE